MIRPVRGERGVRESCSAKVAAVIERPRHVTRDIPETPADPVTQALADQRYADLEAWSRSARTVLMPAVPPAAAEPVHGVPGTAVPLPDVTPVPTARARAPRGSAVVLGGVALALLAGGTAAVWDGGAGESRTPGSQVSAPVVPTRAVGAASPAPTAPDAPPASASRPATRRTAGAGSSAAPASSVRGRVTSPRPAPSTSRPALAVPRRSAAVPGTSRAVPGSSLAVPGASPAVPGPSRAAPDAPASAPDPSPAAPGSSAPAPGSWRAAPGSSGSAASASPGSPAS